MWVPRFMPLVGAPGCKGAHKGRPYEAASGVYSLIIVFAPWAAGYRCSPPRRGVRVVGAPLVGAQVYAPCGCLGCKGAHKGRPYEGPFFIFRFSFLA